MNDLTSEKYCAATLRMGLLATASVFAMFGSACAASGVDADKPVTWIELGGQLERIDTSPERFSPPFVAKLVPGQLTSPIDLERPSRYSNGGEGTIKFEPAGSDWIISASARYGRTKSKRHIHEEYAFPRLIGTPHNLYESQRANVEDTATSDKESHTIVDFQVGRDVGVGFFGSGGVSDIDVGLRAVQFHSGADTTIYTMPDSHLVPLLFGPRTFHYDFWHNYNSTAVIHRNASGIGPSAAWNSTIPLISTSQDSQLELNWGANASVLFGRQKARAQHKTVARYRYFNGSFAYTTQTRSAHPDRTRNVTIPNVGGFAGITYRIANFKMSAGYRGDFFFGAMDGGIDRHKSTTVGFYGPFATISIGFP